MRGQIFNARRQLSQLKGPEGSRVILNAREQALRVARRAPDASLLLGRYHIFRLDRRLTKASSIKPAICLDNDTGLRRLEGPTSRTNLL